MSPGCILLFLLVSVCHSDDAVQDEGGFYFSSPQTIEGFTESEESHNSRSCKWKDPPENGFNAMQCSVGVCQGKSGSYSRQGTRRFTRCRSHYTLINGNERDVCRNGSWSSSGHECVQCGKSPKTFNALETIALVVNGYNSSKGDFPWMAAIFKSGEGGRWAHLCGGTLISPDIVLTAAHCLDLDGIRAKPEEIKVGLGRLSLYYNRNETGSVIISAKKVIIPERFVGVNRLYDLDIALILLEKRAPIDDFIMPACLDMRASKPPTHDDYGVLAGWGLTDDTAYKSETLKWTYQRYIGYQECTALMSGTDYRFLTPDKFCTDTVKGGLADSGDNGGGLTFQRGGRHYVYGVVSTKMYLNVRRLRLFTNLMSDVHRAWLSREWRKLQTSSSRDNAGACCNGFGDEQDAFYIGSTNINTKNENKRGQGSCQWEKPPDNGINLKSCYKGLCQESVGAYKSNGTLRLTRCNDHHILLNGSDEDLCVNGRWTSTDHLCSPCGRLQSNVTYLEDTDMTRSRKNSSRGDFPWTAAIYAPMDEVWTHVCQGVLISPRLVLSVALCFINRGEALLPTDVRVGLGKLFREISKYEKSSIISDVQEIVVSQQYLGIDSYFEMNIALLVLQQAVDTGHYVMPACVDWNRAMIPKYNEVGYFAGWGVTEDGNPSAVLRWVSRKYVPHDECLKMIPRLDRKYVTKEKFCVTDLKAAEASRFLVKALTTSTD